VELFTGQANGTVVGMAEQVAAGASGFVTRAGSPQSRIHTHPDALTPTTDHRSRCPRPASCGVGEAQGLTLISGST